MKEMKQNNRGFSLIELVVTVAILAVVTLAVGLMMSSGSGLFRNLNTIASLQNQSQVTMAQLQEYLLDINGGITCDGADTYFTVFEDENSGRVYRLTYDSTDQTLLFDEGSVSADHAANTLTYSYHTPQVTLCSRVSSFSLTPHVGTEAGIAESVTIELTLTKNGKSFSASQVFSLRNRPELLTPGAAPVEELLSKVWFDSSPDSFTANPIDLIS